VTLFSKANTRRAAGDDFESKALAFLERSGLILVTRNWRCAQGEIDLVMRDGASLIFVEVRHRRSSDFGGALASIDQAKLLRVCAAVNVYISKLPRALPYRIDAVAFDADRKPQWIKSIVT
jgi:putative endonuclease